MLQQCCDAPFVLYPPLISTSWTISCQVPSAQCMAAYHDTHDTFHLTFQRTTHQHTSLSLCLSLLIYLSRFSYLSLSVSLPLYRSAMSMMKEDQPSAQTLSAKFHNAIDGLVNPPSKSDNLAIQAKYKEDTTRSMRCCEWRGKEHMEVVTRPAPDITESGDAIIKVTTTLICGSGYMQHAHATQLCTYEPLRPERRWTVAALSCLTDIIR